MTATQAPTPGPLSGDDVKLLVKGDLLLCADRIVRAVEQVDVERGAIWFTDGEASGPSVCAFIGRPDADGWMQWSGGENPVPGRMVEVKIHMRGELIPTEVNDNNTGLSDSVDWDHRGGKGDIIAFRLTPTAPARSLRPERWGVGSWLSAALDDPKVCDAMKSDIRDWFNNGGHLRPQPSGETREVSGHDAHTFLIEFANAITGATLEQRIDHLQAFSARLNALLSARPLALGGQQGVEKHAGTMEVLQRLLQSGGETFHSKEQEWALKSAIAALSTTPARAEALSEDDARRRLIQRIEQWDSETEYDAEDIASLADDILHEFNGAPVVARAEAQDEGALSILDRLLDHSGARGSFDAMRHGDAVKDAEELLRSARSPGHTDLMVTPESIDAYMKDNPMEAQDEGAAGELKPCPFCGGEAEIIHLDDGDNADGSCVCCTKCQASGNVEFGRKENFVDNWNRRAHPSPTPAADEDRVRMACEIARDDLKCEGPEHELIYQRDRSALDRIATGPNLQRAIAAALKSEGK